ncbi:MAG TPA: Fic family protein [Conexibacter sp.]|nr:Fic family protein [Conexibacter sp.]
MQPIVARAESALAAPFAGFDDTEMYPDLVTRAAILCSRLLRNHPLPDGNKRVAYLCMIELIRRNGATWRPVASERERVDMIERLAARQLDEAGFVTWLAAQVRDVPESM